MEFTVTEEFVRDAHGAACSTWKTKIEQEFPDLFKTELEAGKWYKGNVGFESLIFITEIEDMVIFNKIHYYGFFNDAYEGKNYIANRYHEVSLVPASREEVESALITEAKKRGYKKGVTCIFGTAKEKRQLKTDDFIYENQRLMVKVTDAENDIIFKNGIWAEILPGQKTIITKGKALRIIAKKLKVSPESIEIQ